MQSTNSIANSTIFNEMLRTTPVYTIQYNAILLVLLLLLLLLLLLGLEWVIPHLSIDFGLEAATNAYYR